jgi:NADH-quinone oxidoreductase subunit I
MKRLEQMTFAERMYLPEIVRGLVVTGYHFWRNLFLNVAHQVGLMKNRRSMVTVQYPEERKRYGDHYRGSHRLTLKEDGSVRCTSCFLCATACPANCIYIEAAESPDPTVEKYPARYEIDTLRCIYCGYCVEACPCDAIRMDSGMHMPPSTRREHFLFDKETLMAIPGADGTFKTENPRHEPGEATHPGIDRERGH